MYRVDLYEYMMMYGIKNPKFIKSLFTVKGPCVLENFEMSSG
jgi:hypothetical protein